MSVHQPYVRFMNLIESLQLDDLNEPIKVLMNYSDLLYYIAKQTDLGKIVSLSELVYTDRFGTYKSIYRRIKELQSLRLINLSVGEDKRVRQILLSERGAKLLQDVSQSIVAAGYS